MLVKSRGDVVLYDDFYKSDIDWKSLSEDKKRELYTEFVLHYLPKELGDAAVGNPITFLIMIIVGVIAKAGAVIAACASLVGAGFSALNIIEGCKLIYKSAEGYDSIYDVNAAKVSAKDLARGIALLGIEIIPVLFGLIKRGIAKYNNKAIKVGENARARTQNELADIVGKNINDVGSIEGYEKFKRKDGTTGLRRQKGKAGQLDQLTVDENGIIHNIDAEKKKKPRTSKKTWTNLQKGNYGEMKMHEHYEKNGYTVISKNPTRDINAKGHQGIDGIYYKKDGHPPYIVGEAKYGSGGLDKLKDGTKQMNKEWIESRLLDSVDMETYLDILDKGYESNLFKIDRFGNINIKKLNSSGNILK